MENTNNNTSTPTQQNVQATAQQAPKPAAVTFKEETINQVLNKINDLQGNKQIVLPPNYEPSNALQAAWFKLIEIPKGKSQTLLETCSRESIANALFKMVADGLNPGKNQVYFIPYGNKLECQRSYQGSIALAKRFGGLVKISANVIYEGDKFSFAIDVESGRKTIKEHESSIDNYGGNIKGAYAVATLEDGTVFAEIMSKAQIQKAWQQGAMNGNSPAHKNFEDQMAIKSVINRACKTLINSSDDSVLHTEDDDQPRDRVAENVREDIKANANQGTINIDATDVEVETSINMDEAELVEAQEEETNSVNQSNGQAAMAGPGF